MRAMKNYSFQLKLEALTFWLLYETLPKRKDALTPFVCHENCPFHVRNERTFDKRLDYVNKSILKFVKIREI